MLISNKVKMVGNWETIWNLSSEIQQWAERLPHYRAIKILKEDAENQVYDAYMSAWRDILPVWWRTRQTRRYDIDPARAFVKYHHTGGVTKNMDVVWTFTPTGNQDELLVEITHDWTPNWFLVGGVAAWFINNFIVHNIADKTLATVRKLALKDYQQTGSNQKSPEVPVTFN
jgi:ribosome-associated toxin RatA of RatAB toxin-antitoxin module